MTAEIAGAPILVTVDRDGRLRAFHNVRFRSACREKQHHECTSWLSNLGSRGALRLVAQHCASAAAACRSGTARVVLWSTVAKRKLSQHRLRNGWFRFPPPDLSEVDVTVWHQQVCSHRAAAVAAGCGSAERFVCPYHAWAYGECPTVPGREGRCPAVAALSDAELVTV